MTDMSVVKYNREVTDKAIALRVEGKTIPEIILLTGMKKPSLQKLFQRSGIKLTVEHKENALAKRWANHQPIVDNKKKCSKCDEFKPIEEFHKTKNKNTGLVSSCKDCYSRFYGVNSEQIKARVAKYRTENLQKITDSNSRYYLDNKEAYLQKAKDWASKNPEKVRETVRAYGKRNQKTKNARTSRYRALKIQATPPWLTEEHLAEMRRMYENCPAGYHVDHIVPLRGKNVRGLHVPWNLQYLLALENIKKRNKFE